MTSLLRRVSSSCGNLQRLTSLSFYTSSSSKQVTKMFRRNISSAELPEKLSSVPTMPTATWSPSELVTGLIRSQVLGRSRSYHLSARRMSGIRSLSTGAEDKTGSESDGGVTKPTLSIKPSSCLVDDDFDLVVENLERSAPYTVTAWLAEGGIYAASYAHFIADTSGTISTSKSPSSSGSYSGIDSAGLLWSMDIIPGQKPGRRIMKKDVTKPYEIEFCVFPGHINPILPVQGEDGPSEIYNMEPLVKTVHYRSYLASDVQRIEIREGNIRGTFFIPPGDGPFPATIDLFGTAGGLLEFRSALLASRGVASLALAYFAFEDLPPGLDDGLHMDYFEEAVDWLHNHPSVNQCGVGVIGVSAGATLAVLFAELFNKVKAVISINGTNVNYFSPLYYKGELVKAQVQASWALCTFIEEKEDAISFLDAYPGPDITKLPSSSLKPELSDASFLFVVSGNDLNTHPMFSFVMDEQLREAGKGANSEVLYLDKAGHLVEPPHTMHCFHSYHKAFSACFAWGGEKEAHAQAQVESWAKMLNFLKTKLSEVPPSKL